MHARVVTFITVAACVASAARAEETVQFNRDIRPIFSETCFACHGFDPAHRKADLRLDTIEGAMAIRTNGLPAITPGSLEKSEAWHRINSKDPNRIMPTPESHKTLKPEQIAKIGAWIRQGAKYEKHWAFEPPVRPEVPAVSGVNQPIDAFLARRLKKEGLELASEAPKETLIRRVAFTLTGLPPTIEETQQFLSDASPEAYEKMVDRYLASPRYGEEMGRHWLDKARYADTHGLHLDNMRQAWPYRDWVVRAFNTNQPFDRFTIEQLAGDLLPEPTKEQLTATGFNRCNVTTSEGGSINEEFIFRYAVDRTTTMAETWMGLTVGCAVCHDHKFDPVSAKEFYSLYAFFNSNADPAMDGNALLTAPTIKVSQPEQDQKLASIDAQLVTIRKQLEEKAAAVAYTDPATVQPPPPASDVEQVWLEDDFPSGAKIGSDGHPVQFVESTPAQPVFSGKRALKRTASGLAQDYYNDGAQPLILPQNGVFFAHVYLDPANPPKSIMLQYHAGGWNRRAVWGDYNAIPYGTVNTPERVNLGALPETGKWVQLSFPIEKLNLKPGDVLQGFALTQHGGAVLWDKMGVRGRTDPAADPLRSLIAWRRANKDGGKGYPPDIMALLQRGPEAALKPEEERSLRAHYIQFVCADTKGQFSALPGEMVALEKERAEIEKNIPSTFIYRDLAKPRDSFVMLRGQYDKRGEKVEPGTPAILPPLTLAMTNQPATRLDLARWLVSPEHPMTARVIVNQFWQQVFGVGLVKTPSDFGSQGEVPFHPELLDWLALHFREDLKWDVKALVRSMLVSRAFRQSPRLDAELYERDPENRLLARGPRFRLDAEQIRDNVLFVSGLMDHTMGGVGVNPYQPPNIWEPVGFAGSNTRNYKQDKGSALYRRSLYTFLKRTAPPPFMANFDGPNREQGCLRRERSNTPLQALQLMNDIQHVEAARVFAERILREGGQTPEDHIRFAYRTVLSRPPDAEELQILAEQLAEQRKHFEGDAAGATNLVSVGERPAAKDTPPVQLAAYTMLASTILNLDETLNRN